MNDRSVNDCNIVLTKGLGLAHENKIVDNTIFLYLDSSVYSRDALMKCLYWYANRFDISIEKNKEQYFEVVLEPLPTFAAKDEEIEKMFIKLKQDVVDFNLRDIVAKETQNVRELLIAKAFSNFDTEELPPEISGHN